MQFNRSGSLFKLNLVFLCNNWVFMYKLFIKGGHWHVVLLLDPNDVRWVYLPETQLTSHLFIMLMLNYRWRHWVSLVNTNLRLGHWSCLGIGHKLSAIYSSRYVTKSYILVIFGWVVYYLFSMFERPVFDLLSDIRPPISWITWTTCHKQT